MAKTLLNGVNEVLKKVGVIQGDSGAFSSLSDSARQIWIDTAVQCWNEAIDELYSLTGESIPSGIASSTLTILTSTRAYSLASGLVRLHWPLHDTTNGQFIDEYPGGYERMIHDEVTANSVTGQSFLAAINPTTGGLYLNALPTSAENGTVYTYYYETDLGMSTASASMPFSDAVFRAMVPAVAELWRKNQRNTFDKPAYDLSLARAGRLALKIPQRDSYLPARVVGGGGYDPYGGD